MKLIYGTANPAKLHHMKEMLEDLDIELVGLNNMDIDTIDIIESGNNPLENARIKALSYYKHLGKPVFSCDSGLFIEGLEDDKQPGVFVRRVNGRVLTDEEMIGYYARIAKGLGGKTRARYINAICLVMDENNIFEHDGKDISSGYFYLTSVASNKRNAGFPLDSISKEVETGKYFIDFDNRDYSNVKLAKGFKAFFHNAIGIECK